MTKVYVSEALRDQVRAFVAAHGVPWDLVDAEPADLRVALSEGDERCESTVSTLEAGGWIRCATAWGLAQRHGIPLDALGDLLNELNIKVRQCSLGCFK